MGGGAAGLLGEAAGRHAPARKAPTENVLRHVDEAVFPGGCFFASVAAELDTHPGPVRDRALQVIVGWTDLLETAAGDAQAEGQIDAATDVGQLVFDLDAYMLLANAQFVIHPDPLPMARARRAIANALAAAAPAGETVAG